MAPGVPLRRPGLSADFLQLFFVCFYKPTLSNRGMDVTALYWPLLLCSSPQPGEVGLSQQLHFRQRHVHPKLWISEKPPRILELRRALDRPFWVSLPWHFSSEVISEHEGEPGSVKGK